MGNKAKIRRKPAIWPVGAGTEEVWTGVGGHSSGSSRCSCSFSVCLRWDRVRLAAVSLSAFGLSRDLQVLPLEKRKKFLLLSDVFLVPLYYYILISFSNIYEG